MNDFIKEGKSIFYQLSDLEDEYIFADKRMKQGGIFCFYNEKGINLFIDVDKSYDTYQEELDKFKDFVKSKFPRQYKYINIYPNIYDWDYVPAPEISIHNINPINPINNTYISDDDITISFKEENDKFTAYIGWNSMYHVQTNIINNG